MKKEKKTWRGFRRYTTPENKIKRLAKELKKKVEYDDDGHASDYKST